MKNPHERVINARKRLMCERPFYGSLGMRLAVSLDSANNPTAYTNGTQLVFNPDYVTSLTDAELLGLYAHEILHCSLRHPYRIGARDKELANIAADYVVNQILTDEIFTLPAGALLDPRFRGMSFEQIYAILDSERPPDTPHGSSPGASNSGNPMGGFGPPSPQSGDESDATAAMDEHDWDIATQQAELVASKAGVLAGGTARAIKASRESVEDWRAILREFVANTVATDYSITRPNRRHIANDIYLPGWIKDNAPRFTIAIDTSGSISQRLLDLFSAEINAIKSDVMPDGIDIIYCDARVNGVASFGSDEDIKLSMCGGGGTAFGPVFEHVMASGELPACLIYFTDLESSDTPLEPDYPVLWITSDRTRLSGPFGSTVRLSQWD